MYIFYVYITCSALPCSATIGQAVHQLLLIQAFRPDRLLAMSHIFVAKVLGETFMNIIEQPLDLANIVDSEVVTNISAIIFSPEAFAIVRIVESVADIPLVSVGEAQHSSADVFCTRL